MNPHQVTKDFEAALCDYTGAPYACVVTSCTMALLIALSCHRYFSGRRTVSVPKRTYVSVPMTVLQSGNELTFRDEEWSGSYRLGGTGIWDCARRFTSGMYRYDDVQCVSFHASKILALEQGGAILSNNAVADAWYRRARFDGRTEGLSPNEDAIQYLGYHAYVSPSVSAMGLMKLSVLPKHNEDLPNSNYPDLSLMPAFSQLDLASVA